MLHFGGGEYYSNANQRLGGLMDMSSEEEEEQQEQGPSKMDENEDEQQQLQELETEAIDLIFPDPAPLIEYSNDQSEFRFCMNKVPLSFASIVPQIIEAMGTWDEATARQKAAIAFNPCMPMPVHSSPLVSLFENRAVAAAGQKEAPAMEAVAKPKYVSFMRSCYELHQLMLACNGGLIKFHPSFTQTHLEAANAEYTYQQSGMEATHNAKIDALYHKMMDPAVMCDMKQTLAEFVSLLESYTLHYIHLMEYYIHTCLIEPHNSTTDAEQQLPLEACMTPNVVPTLDMCHPSRRAAIVKDMIDFFAHKVDSRAVQERENAANGVQNTDAPPLEPLVLHDVESIVRDKHRDGAIVYNGYIPLRTIYQYFCFMDVDGVMAQKN